MEYFKFSPSIRGVFGINDELVRDNDPNSPWTSNIESLKTRGILINFTVKKYFILTTEIKILLEEGFSNKAKGNCFERLIRNLLSIHQRDMGPARLAPHASFYLG